MHTIRLSEEGLWEVVFSHPVAVGQLVSAQATHVKAFPRDNEGFDDAVRLVNTLNGGSNDGLADLTEFLEGMAIDMKVGNHGG
jgi:hypothetical protein